MDTAMAWQAYSGFYRGYDMTTATSAFAESVWPHTSHHPFGNPGASGGGHEVSVNPLDPLQIASSTPSLDPHFGPTGDPSSDICNRDADTPEYKASHFLNGTVGPDHPVNRTGATRPSPDSGLTISDGVSSSGSPNQSSQNNPVKIKILQFDSELENEMNGTFSFLARLWIEHWDARFSRLLSPSRLRHDGPRSSTTSKISL